MSLGQPPEVCRQAQRFLRVYCLALPALMYTETSRRFLQCQNIVKPFVWIMGFVCFFAHPFFLWACYTMVRVVCRPLHLHPPWPTRAPCCAVQCCAVQCCAMHTPAWPAGVPCPSARQPLAILQCATPARAAAEARPCSPTLPWQPPLPAGVWVRRRGHFGVRLDVADRVAHRRAHQVQHPGEVRARIQSAVSHPKKTSSQTIKQRTRWAVFLQWISSAFRGDCFFFCRKTRKSRHHGLRHA